MSQYIWFPVFCIYILAPLVFITKVMLKAAEWIYTLEYLSEPQNVGVFIIRLGNYFVILSLSGKTSRYPKRCDCEAN